MRDRGFAIKGVSSDTFQSANIQQELKADGFRTEIISVDRIDNASRICLPYQYLKSAIYERRISIYKKCDLLTDELIGLERMPSGKIDHTADGINSKDQADAVCGALFLASKFSDEYSYSYGDHIVAGLDVNNDVDDRIRKEQIIADLQNELAMMYTEQSRNNRLLSDQQKREEYERYKNILDGIIIV